MNLLIPVTIDSAGNERNNDVFFHHYKTLKFVCIEIFDNCLLANTNERLLKTEKKAFYRLLIPVSIPEI